MSFSNLRLRTQFIILFILLGLVPLISISFAVLYQFNEALLTKSFHQLDSIQDIRRSELEKDFNTHLDSIVFMATNPQLLEVVNQEKPSITKEHEYFIREFLIYGGYSNLFLIGGENDTILYSTNNTKKLFSNSGLSRAWNGARQSPGTWVEDFSIFNDRQIAYISRGIFDKDGICKAVLVLELESSFIDRIIDSTKGMGLKGESYLISYSEEHEQFEFRSSLKTIGDGIMTVGVRWMHPLDYWQDARKQGLLGGHGIYTDSQGDKVLVQYNKLELAGLEWYLISKIDYVEITAPISIVTTQLFFILLIFLVVIIVVSFMVAGSLIKPITKGVSFAAAIAAGEVNKRYEIDRKDEIGTLSIALNNMAHKLQLHHWYHEGKSSLDDALRGEHNLDILSEKFLYNTSDHLNALYGAIYINRDDKVLVLQSNYGFTERKEDIQEYKWGEGFIGKCAKSNEIQVVDTNLPSINLVIGTKVPDKIIAMPIRFERSIIGVVLYGIEDAYTNEMYDFLEEATESFGVLYNIATTGQRVKDLLQDSQIQQEELRASNEELEKQTVALTESEISLQKQQEQLRVINEELEERTQSLEKQSEEMRKQNLDLNITQQKLEEKAMDLELASKYKSEFLANMSHELRTPLNSILILSELLSEEKNKNLSEKQLQSVNTIHSSGSDLLRLINEILDLSKIESGKIDIEPHNVYIASIVSDVKRGFEELAKKNKIVFKTMVDEDVPIEIFTDSHRYLQILRNLITNAFKFTKKGQVTLHFTWSDNKIHASVIDTGIGIPVSKHESIFEAFRQADGSTSRKFGGTGLGLSISKQLANLLGADLTLKSTEGEGSTFTLSLCTEKKQTDYSVEIPETISPAIISEEKVNEAPLLLVIEDDIAFAEIIRDAAIEHGYDVEIADSGEAGLYLADYRKPQGIILDIGLPGIDGFEVLRRLKESEELKHIPVHILSGQLEKDTIPDIAGYIQKPAEIETITNVITELRTSADVLKETNQFITRINNNGKMKKDEVLSDKKVLLVDDDMRNIFALSAILEEKNIDVTIAKDGVEALEKVKEIKDLDLVLMDIMMPKMDGFEAIKEIRKSNQIPIIALTAQAMENDRNKCINAGANDYLAKPIISEKLLSMLRVWLY